MAVSTRVFLILLVTLLVQGAPPTPDHDGNDSGHLPNTWCPKGYTRNDAGTIILPPLVNHNNHRNHEPLECSSPKLPINVDQPIENLRAIDLRFGATILPDGSTYGIPPGSTDTPIPTDGYYRVPSMVVIVTPKGDNPHLTPSRIVRLSKANIRTSHIDNIPLVPILPIDQFLHHVLRSADNDKLFEAIILPQDSKHHVPPSTTMNIIPTDRYFQLPSTTVVITIIGNFHHISGRVVRIVQIRSSILSRIERKCGAAYAPQFQWLQEHEREAYEREDAYLERCKLHNMRSFAIHGPFQFYTPTISSLRQ